MKPKLIFGSGLIVGFVVAFALLTVLRAHYSFRTGPQGILWRCDNFTGQVSWAQPSGQWQTIAAEKNVTSPPWEDTKDPLGLFKK